MGSMAIARRIRPGRTREPRAGPCRGGCREPARVGPPPTRRSPRGRGHLRPLRRPRGGDRRSVADPATMVGIRGYDHLWDDFSTAGFEHQNAVLEGQLARVRAADTGGDPWGALAAEVAAAAHRGRTDPLRHRRAPARPEQHRLHLAAPTRRVRAHGQGAREDWEAVASRLEGLPAAADAYRHRLEDGRRRGLAVARRQAVEGARQARHAAGESSALRRLAAEYEAAGLGDDALRAAGGRRHRECPGRLRGDRRVPGAGLPALHRRRRRGGRGALLPPGPPVPGLGARLRETYAWGWEEVARLLRRMEETATAILPGAARPRCCACSWKTRRGRPPRPRSSAP